MKTAELARLISLSPSRTRALAAARRIPETIFTKGGHYRFRDTPALRRWIESVQPGDPKRGSTLGYWMNKPAVQLGKPKSLGRPLEKRIEEFRAKERLLMKRQDVIAELILDTAEELSKISKELDQWISEDSKNLPVVLQENIPFMFANLKGMRRVNSQLKQGEQCNWALLIKGVLSVLNMSPVSPPNRKKRTNTERIFRTIGTLQMSLRKERNLRTWYQNLSSVDRSYVDDFLLNNWTLKDLRTAQELALMRRTPPSPRS